MKLALYHPWIYVTGGVERSLLHIVSRSRHDWTLYTHHFDSASTFPGLREARVVVLDPQVSVRRALPALAQAAYRIGRAQLPLRDEQALLVSSEGLGDFVMARNHLPTVCYCHTPLKILHDPITKLALKERDARKYVALRALGPGFNAVDRRMWKRYRHVLANSYETAHRIERAGLAGEDEIEVLHPGVDLEQFTLHPALPRERFFLVAGRIMWEKRIELAIQALRAAREHGTDASLIIAGGVDSKSRPYLQTLREHAEGLPVEFVVDPSDEDLASLYARCLAVVFTAPNEDWGVVPLEAMASGAPVLAVDAGGPRESVIHNVTGWLLPPTPWAFAEQMRSVASSEAGRLVSRRAARRRAQQFAADAFVARLDDVMEQVALYGAATPPMHSIVPRPVRVPPLAVPDSEETGS